MKLLTSGGLLYSAAQAANADGSSGTYQHLDWVATIPEAANGGITASTTTTPIGIGWDPVVVEVISNWDGGKTIAGFGKSTGTIYSSWVIKMWGASGTANCGNDSKISGYVTMVLQLNSEHSTANSANCSLAANAKVQWAWTNLPATLFTVSTDTHSYVVTSATEEWIWGAAASAVAGADPYIIVAGGQTSQAVTAYGLNSWSMVGEFITFDGVTATGTDAITNPSTIASLIVSQNLAANLVWGQAAVLTDASTDFYKNTQTAMNHCWTALSAQNIATDNTKRAVIAGYSGSITTCLKHAVDGYSFWGAPIMGRVGSDWQASTFNDNASTLVIEELFSLTRAQGTQGTIGGTGQTGLNLAQIRVIRISLKADKSTAWFLATTSEYYADPIIYVSDFLAATTDFISTTNVAAMARADYGAAWNFWPFLMANTNAATTLTAQLEDAMIFCGVKKGQGNVFRGSLNASSPYEFSALNTAIFTDANASAGFLTIDAPTGGMGQFKGTAYGTTEKKYVQTICLSIMPLYATAMYINLDADTSGSWVLSCYTGIPQCAVDQVDSLTALTSTEAASCMDDPRYMNWRVMTIKVAKEGTASWWRVDSYWDATSSMFSSTWGVGVELSMNAVSNDDNNGTTTTDLGRTYVFAYGDGSGIQLNHLAFGTTPVSTNTTAGAGTNTLTTAPTSFSNTSPLMVNQQYCGGSNLELTGTADTSALSATITDWSDGYKAKVTMNLEMILPGAAGGWRGVCMVYYSSVYVMDNTNGAICFAAQVNSASGSGPTDFGAGYLMDVASSVWQPPMSKSSLAPSSAALTGGKYDIVYAPSAATAFMYTEGYYASVTWYQPKYASSYSGIARYGKDDYLGAYCMQGAGSNSYFGTASVASQKLTGAMYLAVGVISLGTALSLAI